eukprot:snap_masked-scaffold41_size498431-processed-gene-0.9 protein:Tk00189 transcript:snap_masked-scaffold41_size498431-processed-gene-0.9-mRNA-1 annotation:"zinc finger protein and btb domain-containing"
MGTSHESFVLRWNEFQANISQSFQEFRQAEDFCDVTLACDEETQLRAHRVILAASSGYFRSLLKRNSGPNPILVMPPNVSIADLSNLVEFMYFGEVSVHQDDIESFMKLAELMSVKGLVEEKPKMVDKLQNVPGLNVVRKASGPPLKRATKKGPGQAPVGGRKGPPGAAKSSKKRKLPPPEDGEYPEADPAFPETFEPGFGSPPTDDGFMDPPPGSAESPGASGTRLIALQCPKCPSRLPGVTAFKEHMELYHAHGTLADSQAPPETDFLCEVCDKEFKSRKSLLAHLKRIHKIVPSGSGPSLPCEAAMMPVAEEEEPEPVSRPKGQVPKGPPLPRAGDLSPLGDAARSLGGVARGPQRPQQTRLVDGLGRTPGTPSPKRGRGRGVISETGPNRPDLQKLGMKYGGKVSFSPLDAAPRRYGPDKQLGLSITKLKGDNSHAHFAPQREGGPRPGPSSRPPMVGTSDMPPIVKQEPNEHFEDEDETGGDYEGEYNHQFADSTPFDPASQNGAPNPEAMYVANNYEDDPDEYADYDEDTYDGSQKP